MRRITSEICRAFESRQTLRIDNSRTDGNALYLFNNKIAEYRNGELWITNAGWMSKTTKERLNGLNGVTIVQKRGAWFLNGVEWSGEWVSVSSFIYSEPVVDEVEFDTTSEWTGSYSKPVYSVFHTHEESELSAVEEMLRAADVPCRRMESDTAGKYKPNHFIVVQPKDIERSMLLIV